MTNEAIVVGAGPNGLAAAITLARSGIGVTVYEGSDKPGGGCRSDELTLPGFVHDTCSAIHPLAAASPFFKSVPLAKHDVELIQPPAALAHPLDGEQVVVLERSIDETAAQMGVDADAYRDLMGPLVKNAESLVADFMGPLGFPDHPIPFTSFGMKALRSASGFAKSRFDTQKARAIFAGIAAHSFLPLTSITSAAYGLMLAAVGHAIGWPLPRGGSQRLTDALVAELNAFGGTLETGHPVAAIDELPDAKAYLLDVTPKQIIALAGDRLPEHYLRKLTRYRYGPGVFKIDYALSEPVPWTADGCLRAGTVHLGGTLDEIAASEQRVADGVHPEKPYMLVAQQSLFDDSRAPAGKHTLWTYCHVPSGSTVDMTDAMESQIERFAPGFKDVVEHRHAMGPIDLERRNPNYVGGDINGGLADYRQLFTRPVARLDPYTTPSKDIFICSSSTPPSGGVHGMCGYHAARSALKHAFGVSIPS
ncbi:MAG: phytoene desaturase family protein [Actinomycetota bacterium]